MKILIIKTSSLGDIIQSFPVIALIKQSYPEAEIDWVVEKRCSSLVARYHDLNKIIEIDTKKWKSSLFFPSTWKDIAHFRRTLSLKHYDYVFDLQGNVKSGMVLACALAENKVGFGKKSVPEWPNLFFTNKRIDPPKGFNIRDDYLFLVKQTLKIDEAISSTKIEFRLAEEEQKELNSLIERFSPIIIIAPGSRWKNKCLSVETLKELISHIHVQFPEATCLYTWGIDEEKCLCDQLAERGPVGYSFVLSKQPLHALHYLMGKAQLVLAMDSLPLHLAGITGTPTVSFFGPSKAQKYAPVGSLHISIQGKCPYGKTFEKRCPVLRTCKTGACIKNLRVQEIISDIALKV